MQTHTRPNGIIAVTIEGPDGRQVTASTGCRSQRKAEQVIRRAGVEQIELAARSKTLTMDLVHRVLVGKRFTISAAIDEWSDWRRNCAGSSNTAVHQIEYVNKWARECEKLTASTLDVTDTHIMRWINRDDPCGKATRQFALHALRSFFRYLKDKGFISVDPTATVSVRGDLLSHGQKERRSKRVFTADEFDRLITYLHQQSVRMSIEDEAPKMGHGRRRQWIEFWYCASLIGRWSGLRLGDICGLEWDCFTEPGVMIVWTDKRDRRVRIPISGGLAFGIGAIPVNADNLCFPIQAAIASDPLRRHGLSQQFSRLLKKAGVTDHHFHELRATLATDLKCKGSSIEEIAEVLGHSSTKPTEGYVLASSASASTP